MQLVWHYSKGDEDMSNQQGKTLSISAYTILIGQKMQLTQRRRDRYTRLWITLWITLWTTRIDWRG